MDHNKVFSHPIAFARHIDRLTILTYSTASESCNVSYFHLIITPKGHTAINVGSSNMTDCKHVYENQIEKNLLLSRHKKQ
ncbi:putative stabilin-2 [Sesbania bispinosa]|nr:putative stabilin-2 [Sesbania bispinosa]